MEDLKRKLKQLEEETAAMKAQQVRLTPPRCHAGPPVGQWEDVVCAKQQSMVAKSAPGLVNPAAHHVALPAGPHRLAPHHSAIQDLHSARQTTCNRCQ